MNTIRTILRLYLKDIGWRHYTRRQKTAAVVFGVSGTFFFLFLGTWLCIPFGIAAYVAYLRLRGCDIQE